MAEQTNAERLAEVERQLKRLRAAAQSVLLVGGTEDEVDEAVREAKTEVNTTSLAAMAERNRRLVEEARGACPA